VIKVPLKEINEVLKKRATRCFVIALYRKEEVSFLSINNQFNYDIKNAMMFNYILDAIDARNRCADNTAFIMPIKIEFTPIEEESPIYLLNKSVIQLTEMEKAVRHINDEYGNDFSFPALVRAIPPIKGKEQE